MKLVKMKKLAYLVCFLFGATAVASTENFMKAEECRAAIQDESGLISNLFKPCMDSVADASTVRLCAESTRWIKGEEVYRIFEEDFRTCLDSGKSLLHIQACSEATRLITPYYSDVSSSPGGSFEYCLESDSTESHIRFCGEIALTENVLREGRVIRRHVNHQIFADCLSSLE